MQIFVYGTLQSAALRLAVAGGAPLAVSAARLDGYGVLPVAGNVVPLIRAKAGSVTDGAVLTGITEAQLARLDAYEGAFGYALIDVDVQTSDGLRSVKMYLPPDDIEVGAGDWSFSNWTAGHEEPAVLAATELFAYVPALSHAEIRTRWHMVEKRAWAKVRAKAQIDPTTVRREALAGDVNVQSKAAPQGAFFGIQAIKVSYTQYDGAQSDVLPREVFVGIDAALVLPYDAKRDRVLLVEQIRMGPVVRHDPQPWCLEPIAGMVDARETPLQAALRESEEEAGLSDLELRHISSFYPSPGSSTDYFHAYLGLCDLPDSHASFGGLEEEAEDLRLHLLDFTKAMELVRSGEINAGPLVMMLYWLASERDALRAGR
ncbi:NUDIX domain-containing protein [bacterium]|nr:NUDIX domain-containing protein [bacterium]